MGNTSTITPNIWLAKQFEWEWCAECHGGAEDHAVLIFFDNWFAMCRPGALCRIEDCQEHLAQKETP